MVAMYTTTMIYFANELANNYPVIMREALEYVKIDINEAEMACKMRAAGATHESVLWALRAGLSNIKYSSISGVRYKNLAELHARLSEPEKSEVTVKESFVTVFVCSSEFMYYLSDDEFSFSFLSEPHLSRVIQLQIPKTWITKPLSTNSWLANPKVK